VFNTFIITKNPYENSYQPMDFENLKKKIHEPQVLRLLPNVCDFQKETITQGMDLKSIEICSIFVISISGLRLGG
jgi:hypothetical protein